MYVTKDLTREQLKKQEGFENSVDNVEPKDIVPNAETFALVVIGIIDKYMNGRKEETY